MQELLDINPAPADPSLVAQSNFENIDARLFGQVTTTYAASVALDFSDFRTRTISLTGNLTLTSTSGTINPGRNLCLRLIADSSSRNLTFPGGWKFLGAAAPGSIAANKTGLLELWAFGTSDSDILARWTVQP